MTIDEEKYAEEFNKGKSPFELCDIFNISKRTTERVEARLRNKGIIGYRIDLKLSNNKKSILNEIKPINWKIVKSKRKKIKKSFKTYLVIADTHIPYENEIAIKPILNMMNDIMFDGFIILGDYMDMEPISHWLQDKKRNKTLENKRMLSDYIAGNKLLDEFDKRLPKKCDKRFFYGNHERFYYDLIEKMPALEGLLDPKIELKLKERGYNVYDKINHVEKIGKLHFTHGMYTTINYVKKHLDNFMCNVMFAHTHSARMRSSESLVKEISPVGYCLPALCNLNPIFMKNLPNKWNHGFGIIYFYENGWFDVDLKRIIKGKFVYNGKLYQN